MSPATLALPPNQRRVPLGAATVRQFAVRITPPRGAAIHYVDFYTDGFAAVIDALRRTVGEQVRISARRLP